MRRYGLLGHDIAYSLSPNIHQIIMKKNNLDGTYDLLEKTSAQIAVFLRQTHYNGMNVTIPYKTIVAEYCEELSVEAAAVGAVNTLTRSAEGWRGDNTDIFGLEMLYKTHHISFENKTVVILGTGGAAKAVEYTLKDKNARHIYKVSRNKQGEDIINYAALNHLEPIDVLFNATPIGAQSRSDLLPISCAVIEKCHTLIDLNYAPLESLLLKQGRALGKTCCNGLDMLIYQAMKSQEIWNGIAVTKELYETICAKLYTILK